MTPYSHPEILETLKRVNDQVEQEFNEIPAEQFFGQGEKWSPAERLLHLIKSSSAVSKGLKVPRTALSLLFGTSKSEGRKYDQLRAQYLKLLAAGARATAGFVPSVDPVPGNPEAEKNRMISKWKEVSTRLASVLQSWNEDDLDKYQLPHPLLGKLTAREMMFFAVFHNLHHLNSTNHSESNT